MNYLNRILEYLDSRVCDIVVKGQVTCVAFRRGGPQVYVRDLMTRKVVTIPSSTHVIDAKRIMQEHNFRRLPVVDNGKLVGLVSERALERVVPAEGSAGGMWDFVYNVGMMYRTPVSSIMHRDVVTVTPDMTAEEALALAQSKRIGALVVIQDGGKVVGIVTTNDFFYRIVNRVLGIGVPGCRIQVNGGGEGKAMEEIISTINKRSLEIISVHVVAAAKGVKKDIILHIDCPDIEGLIADLKAKGYQVDIRRR